MNCLRFTCWKSSLGLSVMHSLHNRKLPAPQNISMPSPEYVMHGSNWVHSAICTFNGTAGPQSLSSPLQGFCLHAPRAGWLIMCWADTCWGMCKKASAQGFPSPSLESCLHAGGPAIVDVSVPTLVLPWP